MKVKKDKTGLIVPVMQELAHSWIGQLVSDGPSHGGNSVMS